MKEFDLRLRGSVFESAPKDMGGNSPVETTGEANPKPPIIETGIKVRPEMIEKIVTLDPSQPEYPLKRKFEDYYTELSSGKDCDYDTFAKKYVLAIALIQDGRYQNLRFLARDFFHGRTDQKELDPRIIELRDNLKLHVQDALDRKDVNKQKKKAEDKLRNFAESVAQNKTLDAQAFRKLVGLFGSSNIVDILYRSRPEFKGIPVEQVSSILADYLGDYLITRGEFKPDDIEGGIEYLSEPTLKDGLMEVIKEGALAFYKLKKKSGDVSNNHQIFDEYTDWIRREFNRFDNKELNNIVTEIEKYYDSLLSFTKPVQIVGFLKEGRDFPDVNQLINIKEIADKKRMLIGDGMGLGKSASAILAKESLGVKQALIVTPSNVISTWLEYLSDKVENDKQIGYFKKGVAPKVLVVEDPRSLKDNDTSSYDYVIVSQEKMNDNYTSELENLGFGMLIVDEAHKLKNLREGVRASNLLRLTSKIEKEDSYLALLSGTPVPNKVSDVAMILKLLYPERFKNMDNKDLVRNIIKGDLVDIRKLLIPRMQMKDLAESIDIPKLSENIQYVDLSAKEKEVYEILMEEDEIEAKDKIRILRQFLLNPELLDVTPSIESSKINAVRTHLQVTFQTKDKVVMFVNGYIENVIRGDKSILPKLKLPDDVQVYVIEGDVEDEERERIQKLLNKTSNGKMLVLISGQTADVGVNFSGADALDFYNEPWTKYNKKQQLGRGHREGLAHPLTSTTFITRGTIEEGIHEYIEIKYKAIEKLLRGIPISQIEQELLERNEQQEDPNLEVNPELAQYYFSSWDRMMKIFSYVKEIGEEDFLKFLNQYGKDYADCYTELSSRSYQANVCRISGTVIDRLVKEHGQNLQDIRILDIASGPEMLKRHIADEYQEQIVSLDINSHHFQGEGGKRIVGSFNALPVQDKSFDYANLSLALHYTKFIPSKGEYERVKVLTEMNRVLKTGGKTVINLMYSLDLRDVEKFKEVARVLGFEVLDEYSGEVEVGNQYKSRIITLQKQRDIEEGFETLAENMSKDNIDGLKWKKTSKALKNSRKIVKEFEMNGQKYQINFNEDDYSLMLEEEKVTAGGERLKSIYGKIKNIPKEDIVHSGYVRILLGKNYVLFKSLGKGKGVVIIK
ncbi:MAG: hypothetical protein A2857_03230 [Candidatus Levybacteria bacterium RIFCSPHIGHO2_01_FULL_36_15]|nr:MAG: hypothetical protein A2857_03230 [Candidatus Levybacteria bacterium RIFCSPHIGHO2_01_FULL_36_15]